VLEALLLKDLSCATKFKLLKNVSNLIELLNAVTKSKLICSRDLTIKPLQETLITALVEGVFISLVVLYHQH
jgi:hypothetical protein